MLYRAQTVTHPENICAKPWSVASCQSSPWILSRWVFWGFFRQIRLLVREEWGRGIQSCYSILLFIIPLRPRFINTDFYGSSEVAGRDASAMKNKSCLATSKGVYWKITNDLIILFSIYSTPFGGGKYNSRCRILLFLDMRMADIQEEYFSQFLGRTQINSQF